MYLYIYIHWYIHTYVHIYSYVCGLFSGESGGGGNPWWSNQTKLQGTFLFIGRCFSYLYPILIIVPEECPNYQLTKTPFWSLVQFFRGAKSLDFDLSRICWVGPKKGIFGWLKSSHFIGVCLVSKHGCHDKVTTVQCRNQAIKCGYSQWKANSCDVFFSCHLFPGLPDSFCFVIHSNLPRMADGRVSKSRFSLVLNFITFSY